MVFSALILSSAPTAIARLIWDDSDDEGRSFQTDANYGSFSPLNLSTNVKDRSDANGDKFLGSCYLVHGSSKIDVKEDSDAEGRFLQTDAVPRYRFNSSKIKD